MIDIETRDRVMSKMWKAGGIEGHAVEILAHGIEPDGTWNADRVNRVLGLFRERSILDRSNEILRIATTLPDIAQPGMIELIDATLETYATRDVGPLDAWLTVYAGEYDQ